MKRYIWLYLIAHTQLCLSDSVTGYDTSFNPNGTFPGVPGVETVRLASFGAGTTSAPANDVAFQTNGQIVAVGSANPTAANTTGMAIAKLNVTDGSLDTSFNSGGTFPGVPGVETISNANFGGGAGTAIAMAIAIQTNGNYVLAGLSTQPATSFAAARVTPNGAFDTSFNNALGFPGVQGAEAIPNANFGAGTTTAFANDVALQSSDGRIVMVGQADPTAASQVAGGSFAFVRLNTDGTLDPAFNAGGAFPGAAGVETIYTASFQLGADAIQGAKSVAIQTNGKIVAVGGTDFFSIVRLNTDGTLDTTFNPSGAFLGVRGIESLWTASFGPNSSSQVGRSVALQSDGQIVVAGDQVFANSTRSFAVARLNASDGSLDTTFNSGGTLPGVPGIAVIPLADFGDTGFEAQPFSVKIQADGKIVLFGSWTTLSFAERFAFVRLNPDGTLDTTFNSAGTFQGVPGVAVIPLADFQGATSATGNSMGIQADGKILGVGLSSGLGMGFVRLGAGCTIPGLTGIALAIQQKYC